MRSSGLSGTRHVGALTAVAILMASAAACGREPAGPSRIEELPRQLSGDEVEMVRSANAFGLKLFRQLRSETDTGENIFISPLSVSMALGMVYNGAAGETRDAMAETLELTGLSVQGANRAYRDLIDLLDGLDPAVSFLLANSIWYRDGFPIHQQFLDVNREFFDADVRGLDFDSPSAPATINAWVDDKTRGRIDQIVDAPIDPLTVMFLLNAIYFKGAWTTRFDEDLTREGLFTLADGGGIRVPMMTFPGELELDVLFGEGLEAVDLPYGGGAYSATIVLPARDSDLGTLIASLDAERWDEIVSALHPVEANVVMPRFELEYEVTLNEALQALGMGVAFTRNANFSGISSEPLYIDKVKHKSYLRVDEEGTEAAAVTSVEVRTVSAPPVILVDRPFLLAIRERLSGTLLFMGAIERPQWESDQ